MSSYLFSKPKVVDGIASLIDLFGTYTIYNESPTNHACIAFTQFEKKCQKRSTH